MGNALTDVRGSEGYAIAQSALDLIRSHALDASVTNYAVWCAYLTGEKPDLVEAIDGFTKADIPLNDAVIQSLYFRHLIYASEDVLDVGEFLQSQLRRATQALAEVGSTTSSYGKALEGAATALRAPIEPHVLESLVRSLVQATRTMRERTRELENRLAETGNEVAALRDNMNKFREESLTDPLTGLANRKRLDEFLDEAYDAAVRDGAPLSIIFCDIDNFKQVNDNWGHTTGDQVIRYIASTLAAAADESHLVARYGGEEFAVIAPGVTLDEACAMADQVRRSIESKVLRRRSTNQHLGNITASFGVAQLVPDETVTQLLERADQALYVSKESGRNRVTGQAA